MLGTYMHFSLENHLPIIPAIISSAGFGIMLYVTCCTSESILTCAGFHLGGVGGHLPPLGFGLPPFRISINLNGSMFKCLSELSRSS